MIDWVWFTNRWGASRLRPVVVPPPPVTTVLRRLAAKKAQKQDRALARWAKKKTDGS